MSETVDTKDEGTPLESLTSLGDEEIEWDLGHSQTNPQKEITEKTPEESEQSESDEEVLDVSNLDISKITDKQLANIKDPEARKIVEDLRKGFYSKSEAIANEKKALDERAKTVAWAEELSEAFEKDPRQAHQMLMGVANQIGQQIGAPTADSTAGPSLNNTEQIQEMWENGTETERYLLSMLGSVAQQMQEVGQSTQVATKYVASQTIQNALTTLEGKYGEFDADLVLETAHKYKMTDLDAAYRLAYFDRAQEMGEKKTRERLTEKEKLSQDVTSSRGTIETKEAQSIEEAFEMALRQHGVKKPKRS